MFGHHIFVAIIIQLQTRKDKLQKKIKILEAFRINTLK